MSQQRALQLFDEWMELPRTEQRARLAQLQVADPTLAAAVAALLQADAADAGVLDRGVQAMVEQVVSPDASVASELAGDQGTPRVEGFHLLRLLGRGGMGEVWLAERRHGDFIQTVALKLLKRGMDSEAITARFLQERRILAELDHPYIARFIDGGTSASGRLYFVMEYVAGENLVAHVEHQRLSVRERVRLMIDVCQAVAYAQSHLVVHRDLKPSNILVSSEGRPRVLDFGIAKVLQAESSDDTLTHTGMQAMSPAYAAPEQVMGESISTATDVYALGVILFELLAGSLPHARKERSLEALAAEVRQEHTRPPSQALKQADATTTSRVSKARLQREIAGDLDTIVLTALRREPERRYRDAAAMADDLSRWLESRPIAAQVDTRSYRLRKFIRRNRLMVGSASGVLLALLTGLSIALWQVGVAREQARIAQEQSARAEREVKSGRRITNFALSLIHELNPHGRAQSQPRTPQALLSDSIQRVRRELQDDAEARAVLLSKLGTLISITGDLEQAEDAAQEALSIAGELHRTDLAMIQFNLAAIRMQQARNPDAEQLLEQALSNFGSDPEGQKHAAMSLSHLARIARGKDQLALALERLTQAQALFATVWGPDHGNTIELAGHRAILLFELGQYDDAETAYRDAIAHFERSLGLDYPRLMAPLTGLAKIQLLRGRDQEALQNLERARAIGISKMGNTDPYVVSTELELVRMFCLQGNLEEAQSRLDGIDETNLKSRPTMLIVLARTRACLARGRGAFDEESDLLLQAQTFAQEANPADSIRLAEVLSERARNAIDRKSFCSAAQSADAADAMFSRLPNVRLIDRLSLIEAQSVLMAGDGRVDAGGKLLRDTAQQLEASLGERSPEARRIRTRLADIAATTPHAAQCGPAAERLPR